MITNYIIGVSADGRMVLVNYCGSNWRNDRFIRVSIMRCREGEKALNVGSSINIQYRFNISLPDK